MNTDLLNNEVMDSQWSDNLRKRMEAHREPSPDGLWEDIERIVTKELPFHTMEQPVKLPSRQKTVLWWAIRTGVAAAILLVLLLVGDLFLKEDTLHSPTITQKAEMDHKPGNNLFINQDKNEVFLSEEAPHGSPIPDDNIATLTVLTSTISIDKKRVDSSIDKKEEEFNSEDQSEHSGEKSGMEKKVIDNPPLSRSQHNDYPTPEPKTHYPIITRRNKPTKWQTNLYAANTSSSSSNTYSGYRSFLAEEISEGEHEVIPLLVKYPHEGIVVANKQSTVRTDTRHSQPVTIGASIKYNLDEKWSLTTGLTYTLLSSELRSGSETNYYTSEQTLHNIGIPLGINYNLWRGRNTSIYVSGGGAVEKNISAKLSTDYIVNDKLESNKKDNIPTDRLQWSVNTSVGVEYNLFPEIGLYAEPGMIYYFKNGSEMQTIYKEKSVNFNLRVGLRFSLGK